MDAKNIFRKIFQFHAEDVRCTIFLKYHKQDLKGKLGIRVGLSCKIVWNIKIVKSCNIIYVIYKIANLIFPLTSLELFLRNG